MIFDKNRYRVNELKKKLSREKDPQKQAKLKTKIEKLRKSPDLFIKFYNDTGEQVVEKVPPEYRGMRGAQRYEHLRAGQSETGTFTPKSVKTAKVKEINNFYLEGKLLGRPGYSSAKTCCNKIDEHLGAFRLIDLSTKPDILARHFAYFPETEWSPKYIWNYRTTLHASIEFWIDTHELFMYNPVDRIKIDKCINVIEYVPTREDFEKVYMMTFLVGLGDEIRYMLVAVYESGLRINEVLQWKIEEMDLNPPRYDEAGNMIFIPYFTTLISKQGQGKKVKKRNPMSRRLWEAMTALVGERESGYTFSFRTPPYKLLRWLICNQCGHRVFDKGHVEKSGKRLHAGDYCPRCATGILESQNLNQAAGVPYSRLFHDYRKSVKYRNKIEKRLPKELTKDFQGHATDSMDEYYLHLQVQDLYLVAQDTWETKTQGK